MITPQLGRPEVVRFSCVHSFRLKSMPHPSASRRKAAGKSRVRRTTLIFVRETPAIFLAFPRLLGKSELGRSEPVDPTPISLSWGKSSHSCQNQKHHKGSLASSVPVRSGIPDLGVCISHLRPYQISPGRSLTPSAALVGLGTPSRSNTGSRTHCSAGCSSQRLGRPSR